MRTAARKALWPTVIIMIGAVWWFSKADFRQAANYLASLVLPEESARPEAGPAVVTRREMPSAPGSRPAPKPSAADQAAMAEAGRRFAPPAPSRPPATISNPPFAAAQRYEAQHDFRNATLAYSAATNFDGGVGPYAEDSLLGLIWMLIADKTPYGHPAACASLERLQKQFPTPRPDLVIQTNLARAQVNCGS
jgi:hypothetical protein